MDRQEKKIEIGDTVYSLCYFLGNLNIVSGVVYNILQSKSEDEWIEMYMFEDDVRRYSLPFDDLFLSEAEAKMELHRVSCSLALRVGL